MHDAAALARLRATRIKALQTKGVGGSTWSVTRKGGDGMTPGSATAPANVTAYVYQEKPGRVMGSLAGTPVVAAAPTMPWWVEIVSGTLQAGDVITSTTDPSLSYTVHRPDPGPLFTKAVVERR